MLGASRKVRLGLVIKARSETMKAYKFKTTIAEDGVIQIPEIAQWANQRVEIFVVIEPAGEEPEPSLPLKTFLEKWRGFLKGHDPDQLKDAYLQEKYR
jgi:hypothetical protein